MATGTKITKKTLVVLVADLARRFGWNTDPKNGAFVTLGVTVTDDDSVGYRIIVTDPTTGADVPLMTKEGMAGADFATFVGGMCAAHDLLNGTSTVRAPVAPVAAETIAEAK